MPGGFRALVALCIAIGAAILTLGFAAALGGALWQADGVSLSLADDHQFATQIASDGSGGAIVTWQDERDIGTTGADIYARRVDGNGTPLWDTDGVSLCVASNDQHEPQIVSDGSGGAIVTWYDRREAITTGVDIYAQRVGGDGNALWDTDGVSLCVASNDQYEPQIVSDGSGGAIVTWDDGRLGAINYNIYAQRVDWDGNTLWNTDGVSLCVASRSQFNSQIAPDGSGGAIVTWEDGRPGVGKSDVYAQLVDQDGNTLWQADGVSLCVATGSQYDPQIVSDDSGGAIVTWRDQRDSGTTGNDIYAQRVDPNGTPLWQADGVSLCVATGSQYYPQIVSDGSGGAIVTWQDYRSGNWDIYAQRVDSDGNVLWNTDGVSVCVASDNQEKPQIVYVGSSGAIVTWQDDRDGGTTGDDIYAQRVDWDGKTQWYTDGLSLCVASNNQGSPQIAPDGYWGAIVTWEDFRDAGTTGYDIYAQRVDGVVNIINLPLVMRRE